MTSGNESGQRASRLRRLIGRLRGVPLLAPAKRRSRYVGATFVALVAAGSITHVAVAQANALPDDAVFRLGDTVLNKQQFAHRTKVMEVLYGVKRPDDKAKQDEFRRATAKAIAVSDILEHAKKRANVVIADKEASDQLDKVIKQSYPQGGREQFTNALGSSGISEKDVLDEIKRQLGNGQMYQKLTHSTPPVKEADAHKTYQQRKDEMVQPEQRHLRNIVTDSKDKASKALARVEAGEDFAAVAREVSMDSSSKENGGDLGKVAKEQLDKEYGKAAFGVKDKGLFGPVKTKEGWHVGQVLKVEPEVPLSFEKVKSQLTTQIHTERKLKVWNSWLSDQIKSAEVEYADDYRPKNPHSPPSGGAPG